MELVVKIPDEKDLIDKAIWRDVSDFDAEDIAIIIKAIANSTPLPKGHGRLIDADYLREDFKASKKISFAERMDISCIVDHAPTIIEADKESEGKE